MWWRHGCARRDARAAGFGAAASLGEALNKRRSERTHATATPSAPSPQGRTGGRTASSCSRRDSQVGRNFGDSATAPWSPRVPRSAGPPRCSQSPCTGRDCSLQPAVGRMLGRTALIEPSARDVRRQFLRPSRGLGGQRALSVSPELLATSTNSPRPAKYLCRSATKDRPSQGRAIGGPVGPVSSYDLAGTV